MPDADLSAAALGRLAPGQLVALLDALDPADPAIAGLDIDVIGTCAVRRESTHDPRVTITVHPHDFLELITNNASGPMLS